MPTKAPGPVRGILGPAVLVLLAAPAGAGTGALREAAGSRPAAPAGITCASCPPLGAQSGVFSGATTESSRLFRDGVASNCPGKAYPGDTAGTFNYEVFGFGNPGAAACVRVRWNPDAGADPCGTNAHAKLYAPGYDPANPATGYLGDVGASRRQNFRATVPAGSPFVLVAETTDAPATCTFAFEIVNVPCQAEPDEFVGDFSGPTAGSRDGRLAADGVPSACGNEAFPGLADAGTPFFYETVAAANDSGSALCYAVDFDPDQCPDPCGVNAFASVHAPAYEPLDPSVGYLGDVGSSAPLTFEVTVGAGSPFEVAVTNTVAQALCNYSVRIRPSVFGDDFEYGDTLSWSVVVP